MERKECDLSDFEIVVWSAFVCIFVGCLLLSLLFTLVLRVLLEEIVGF